MERITLTSLLLSAVVSSSAGVLRQYHFVDQNLNWTDAQKYCREKYTDLVTITDTHDQKDTEQVIKRVNAGTGRVWIGLKSTDSWIWSLSDGKIYRANEFPYWYWGTDSHQPQGEGDCVFMNSEGKWYDAFCNTTIPFICYNASSKEFIRVYEDKTWTEAQRYCREKHTDLASVRNDSDNYQIQSIIANPPNPDTAWIGLHRLWVWSDNSTSTFTHWKDGEPNIIRNRDHICASIDITGRWTDENCTNPHPFVCYDNQLVLIRENLTWTAALRYCRDRDMDLVSVDSEEIQSRVKNVTASASTAHVWLGLRHSCVVGLWFWVNGQTVCYEQWAPGNGTGEEDCTPTVRSGAIQTSDQRWISLPGNQRNNFICIK